MTNNQEPSNTRSTDLMQSDGFWGNKTPTKTKRWSYDATTRRREEIKVRILDPMTHIHDGKAVFTNYRIEIKAPSSSAMALNYSSVRRRYSEFAWLHNKLKDQRTQTSAMPAMPEKKVFGRFAVDFILSRQQCLEEYLHRLMDEDELLGNAYLHLFLQTNFTINEIESILRRKDHEDVHQIIVLATNQRHGHLHSNRSISDSALENSYSSLGTREKVSSSEYYGDDEVPDQSDQSLCYSSNPVTNAESLQAFDSFSSTSQEFEEFFEFGNKKTKLMKCRSFRPAVFTHEQQELVEYLMPISECDVETYVVFCNTRHETIRPRRESNDQRIKKLVNEYEVVSLL